MLEMTNHRFVARAAIAAGMSLLVVAAGACGGSSKPAAGTAAQPPTTTAPAATTPTTAKAATNPDPCTLVTQTEAEKLAETPLMAAVKAGGGDQLLCQYGGPTTGPTAQVEIFSGPGEKKSLDIDRGLGHAFTTLPGVGDEAYLEADNVFVRKGTVWAGVNVVLLDVPTERVQSGLTALATTIASRLP
jgi:hypothetical protein